MNFPFFIAKQVARSGEKSFSLLIIRIAVVAVAISVAVMVISTSLIAGFKHEIRDKVFGFWGHIQITETDLDRSLLEINPIKRDQAFYPVLDTLNTIEYVDVQERFGMEFKHIWKTRGGIHHIQAFALKPGIIQVNSNNSGNSDGSVLEGIILKGIDKDFDWSFMDRFMVEGEPIHLSDTSMSRDILISRQTANRLEIGVGDTFIVNFVQNDNQLVRKFNVSGIYKTGLEEYDRNFALIDIRQIQQLQGWAPDEVAGFEVFVDDIRDLDIFDEYIYYEQLPTNLRSESIRSKYPEIFEWLELQDINEVVILTLMVVVAIINMVTALLILILERTNMIGTLKALGSSNWPIQKIFLYYAAYIIIIGLFWGNLLGIGLCILQEQFGLIKLSEENYYLSVAPVELDFWPIFLINLGTLIVTLFFLVIPTYIVATVKPVKALRFK